MEEEDGQHTPAQILQTGIAAVKRKDYESAITILSTIYGPGMAMQPPDGLSYFALALARGRGKYKTAIKYAELAMDQQFYTADHFINLCEIYLGAKSRRLGVEVLEKGLALLPKSAALIAYRDSIGYRAPSFFPFLHRDHFLNQFFGKTGLRDRFLFLHSRNNRIGILVGVLIGYGGFLYWLFHKLVR